MTKEICERKAGQVRIWWNCLLDSSSSDTRTCINWPALICFRISECAFITSIHINTGFAPRMAYIFNSCSSPIVFKGNIIIATEAWISNGIACIIMLLFYDVFAARNKSLFLYIICLNTLIWLGRLLYRYRSLIALSIALNCSSLLTSCKAKSLSYMSYNCLSARDVKSSCI